MRTRTNLRPVFQQVVGKDLADRTIEAVTDKLNEYYPEFAPWKTIDYELTEDGEFVHRNFLQIRDQARGNPCTLTGVPCGMPMKITNCGAHSPQSSISTTV